MMGTVNQVTLIGNLGADPEVKSFSNGGRVANLRLATTEVWKDRTSGDRRERTEWHRVVIYPEGKVGYVERFLRKGDKIYVQGQLETREWTDKDGQKRYATEVAVRPFKGDVENLSPRRNGDAPASRGHDAGDPVDTGNFGGNSRNMGTAMEDDGIPF